MSSADPLQGAHVAVNRTLPGAADRPPLLADEALQLTEILAAYTSGSARVNGVEDVVGTIGARRRADLVVVDADLAHIVAADIGAARVTSTWIRGELVHGTD